MTIPATANAVAAAKDDTLWNRPMTQDHPITPPPELVQQWASALEYQPDAAVFTQAARWGADQELKACVEWLHWQNLATHADLIPALRAARRKPPSLKEQALAKLEEMEGLWEAFGNTPSDLIRRALEQLDD